MDVKSQAGSIEIRTLTACNNTGGHRYPVRTLCPDSGTLLRSFDSVSQVVCFFDPISRGSPRNYAEGSKKTKTLCDIV